jgi:hypothetical protein
VAAKRSDEGCAELAKDPTSRSIPRPFSHPHRCHPGFIPGQGMLAVLGSFSNTCQGPPRAPSAALLLSWVKNRYRRAYLAPGQARGDTWVVVARPGVGNAGWLKQSATPSPVCHSGIYSRNPASASPQTLQKKLIPASPPHAIVRPRPRLHGRKRNERLGEVGSGPLAVASAEAETFRAPAHGTVEGVLVKASGDWPQPQRTTRPKIPNAWGDGSFIYYKNLRSVHRPKPSIPIPRGFWPSATSARANGHFRVRLLPVPPALNSRIQGPDHARIAA